MNSLVPYLFRHLYPRLYTSRLLSDYSYHPEKKDMLSALFFLVYLYCVAETHKYVRAKKKKKRLSNEKQNRTIVPFSFFLSLPFSHHHTFSHLPPVTMHTTLTFLTTRTIAVVTFLMLFFLGPVLNASSSVAIECPASISQPQPQRYSSVAGTGAGRKMRKRYVPLGGGVGSFYAKDTPQSR